MKTQESLTFFLLAVKKKPDSSMHDGTYYPIT